jgi:hypothetical protein
VENEMMAAFTGGSIQPECVDAFLSVEERDKAIERIGRAGESEN